MSGGRDRVMERVMQWRNEWDKAMHNNQPQMQPCAGRNCGSTNPNLHSAECFEDYEKATGMAQPVAWLWQHRETGRTRVLMPDERTATDVAAAWDVVGPLYLAPPQRPAEPVQEPVAWSHINGTSDTKWHPPQRKSPATIDEMFDRMDKAPKGVFFGHDPMTIWMEAWRAAEQQHGIT